MPATQAKRVGQRVFDSTIKFAIQASEIEEQFVVAAGRRLRQIQSALIEHSERIPFRSPRQTALLVSARLHQEFQPFISSFMESMNEYGILAARAFPRFLNGGPRQERIIEKIDPFDLSDIEEDQEEDQVFGFLEISDDDVRSLLLIVAWNGLTMQQQWEIWLRRRQVILLQQISAGLAQAQIDLADVVDASDQLQRETASIIKRTISGGRGIRMQPGGLKSSMDGVIRTQSNLVTNGVIRSISLRNRELIKSLKWSALLDNDTCMRCRSVNGRTYRLRSDGNTKGPQIPLHGWCRCTWIPVLFSKAFEQTAQRSPLRFNKWFEQQTPAYQRRLLGPSRFQLWVKGELKFSDFVQFRRKVPVRIRSLDSLRKMINA